MKITHIIIGLGVGGAENMLQKLILNSTKEIQHEVISLTTLGEIGAELKSAGVSVVSMNSKSLLSFIKTFVNLRIYLRQSKPDVVQTWMYHADLIGGLAARSVGINNVFWNVRNTFLNGRGASRYFFRKLCASLSQYIPKKIIYVSNSAKENHERAGYSLEKSVVIGNGFDTEKFKFSSINRKDYRKELSVTDDDILIFSVGRFDFAKDHENFVEAIKLASITMPNIRGVLLGNNLDENNVKLQSWMGAFKDKFICLGGRRDVADILSAADIFCLHSKTEGFPNVLGEAMSVGLPCIATRAGDAEYILNNSECTIEISDHVSLSRKILNIASLSKCQRLELGEENRKRVLDNYSVLSITFKYESIYLATL